MASQRSASNAIEIDRLATQLAKDPQSKAFLPLAEEYCKVGMWEEAVSVLEDGLKYYPGFITAMVVLGRAYDQLNQPTKARAVLEGAIKLSPDNLRAHRTLIKIYAAQGLAQEAINSCRVILAMNPKDEEALSVKASLAGPEPDKAPPSSGGGSPQEKDHGRPAPDTGKSTLSKPLTASSVAAGSAMATPSIEPQEQCPLSVQAPTEEPNPTKDSEALRHSGTVAQLESWLRSLAHRRRDGLSGSAPESVP
jgi:tetratricopeptide (TPR) repeat protein